MPLACSLQVVRRNGVPVVCCPCERALAASTACLRSSLTVWRVAAASSALTLVREHATCACKRWHEECDKSATALQLPRRRSPRSRPKWEWASETLGPKWERLAASSALTFVMMSDILIFFDLSVNALPRRQHA